MSTEFKTINLTSDNEFFSEEKESEINDDVSSEGETFKDSDAGESVKVDDDAQSEAASDISGGSINTIEMLSKDPLFLVLSKTFVNSEGHNIVDVLSKINTNLEKLLSLNTNFK